MSHSISFCSNQENPEFATQFISEGYIPWGPGHSGLHIQDDFGNLIRSLPQDHYWYATATSGHILTMRLGTTRDTQYAYH